MTQSRIPNAEHEARRWVISEIASDFDLLDVWTLPVRGSREDFPSFVRCIASLDPTRGSSALSAALFRAREALGRMLRWDEPKQRTIPGSNGSTLASRLPDLLRGTADDARLGDGLARAGARPLYQIEDEAAIEISNETVHGVVHLSWVEGDDSSFGGRMAIYVKPRGVLGHAYLKLISPFRHLIVYPALLREIGRAWGAR
jgi:hypothetical protein